MTPWVIAAPSQFRPDGPPALTSAQYAKDFNETKTMGHMLSSTRTPDQTVSAWFWASATPSFLFNTVAVSLLGDSNLESEKDDHRDSHAKHHDSTLQNARLLAQLNVAIADAAIACYEAKYTYVFWRPVTAIPLAAADGNPATSEDPTWMPLFATPAHPEYPSGHSCLSAAAAGVLADRFGEKTHFTLESDLMPGVVRSFKELFIGTRGSEERPHLCRHSLSIGDRRWREARRVGRRVCPRPRGAASALKLCKRTVCVSNPNSLGESRIEATLRGA
jgi:membrane-associated phospholipid phosphatase